MDTIQSDKARSSLKTVKRQSPTDFQKEMQQAGISVIPLEVTEVKPGLHESAEGIAAGPIYHISWHKQLPRFSGLLPAWHTGKRADKFVKVSSKRMSIPTEAKKRHDLAESIVQLDESTVFLSTQLTDSHLRIILAVRVADQWLELYRWNASWAEVGLSRLEVCQF